MEHDSSKTATKWVIERIVHAQAIFGQLDVHLRYLEREFPVHIVVRGNEVQVNGDKAYVNMVIGILQELGRLAQEGGTITEQTVRYLVERTKQGELASLAELHQEVVFTTHRGKRVRAKTLGQKAYLEAIRKNTLTFGIGPAGTGKTYLAMTMAVLALKNKEVERIILTRPAVEAGEKLGFLPGDLQDKVDPYLRPLYDAFFDLLGSETFEKMRERGVVEIAPLAYMRGRTLDDAFIILDEAQNTTPEQMKMFLTRLGFGSRVVVTGDRTQMDLPRGQKSGLIQAMSVLDNVLGIAFCYLSDQDVVRHELVQRIIRAYDLFDVKTSVREKE